MIYTTIVIVITYIIFDKATPQVWYGVRAKVHERRLAQRQARQAKGNRENIVDK
jgi:hypothetical protein